MQTLTLDDGELSYEVWGDGPALLLLHAGVADSRMWDPQVKHLAQRFRVIRCDLRGYGQSPLPNGPFSYHEDVAHLLDALDLASAWLVGASFGGQVAVDFCLAYPERVDGLILIAPTVSGYEHDAEVKAFGDAEDELLEAGDLEAATELNMRMWVDGPQRSSDAVDGDLRAAVAEMQRQAFEHVEPEKVSLNRLDPPAAQRLGEIEAPLLIVSGELDVVSFTRLAQHLAEQAAHAQLVIVPNAAHLPSLEAPAMVNQLIKDFISTKHNAT